jgi:uncharacterized protein YndB with AHSA1/START domain
MSRTVRQQALIEAPVGEVWDVVSDPRTHPDWWPDVVAIEAPADVDEGDRYVHSSKMMPFVDAVDSVWVVERMSELKEAQFRCTMTGTYARFQLTPAQENTFVELEVGMDPTSWQWKLAQPVFSLQFKRWLMSVLDALPGAVEERVGVTAAAARE